MSILTRTSETFPDPGQAAPAIHMPAMANSERRRTRQEIVRRHSKNVRRLRILLPSLGGVMAVSILVYSIFANSIPSFDLGSLSFDGGGLVMTNPRLAGHSEKGKAYLLEAATATQPINDPDTINLEKVKAFTEMSDDDEANMSAASGIYKTKEEFLTLRKDIVVVTKSGYTIRSQAADVDLNAETLETDTEVTIVSERLDLKADSVRVTEQGKVIKFKGNVKIIWQRKPETQQ